MTEEKGITAKGHIRKVENSQVWVDEVEYWGYGNSITSFDNQPKSVLVGVGNVFRRKGPSEYFPKENFRLNMAMFLTVPYLFSGVMVRAHYSLGLPFRFTDKEANSTVEERYLERRARFLGLRQLFFKTSIHMDVYGNALWYLRRTERGSVYDITMIQPERVLIEMDEKGFIKNYNVLYPDWKNRGLSVKYYTLKPEDVIHFKLNDLGESPWGYSLVHPMIPLLESRMEINKIMPVLFKAYAKPYRHFKFTPPPMMKVDEVQSTIKDMIEMLNQNVEPDSDFVTGDAWGISTISSPNTGDPTRVTEDMDEQIFSIMGIPKYFFKPTGTTDLNISKADQWFRDQMRWKTNYFADMLMRYYILPELESVFPDSDNLPELEFEDKISTDDANKQALEYYKEGAITQEELRKELGKDPLPTQEKEALKLENEETPEAADVEKEVSKSYYFAIKNKPMIAERWTDGQINDSTLISEVKKLKKMKGAKF